MTRVNSRKVNSPLVVVCTYADSLCSFSNPCRSEEGYLISGDVTVTVTTSVQWPGTRCLSSSWLLQWMHKYLAVFATTYFFSLWILLKSLCLQMNKVPLLDLWQVELWWATSSFVLVLCWGYIDRLISLTTSAKLSISKRSSNCLCYLLLGWSPHQCRQWSPLLFHWRR